MNIVFLSLDGVSQTHFWQFHERMPRLWDLSNRSRMYRRFYASATNAFLSFCHLAFGDQYRLDHCLAFPGKGDCFSSMEGNFFQILHDYGYSALGVMHASPEPGYAATRFHGAWPEKCGELKCFAERHKFQEEIKSFLRDRRSRDNPFLLFVSDRSCLFGDNGQEKEDAAELHTFCERGFELLDRTAGFVLDSLAETGHLDETLVVTYGPYGMDPWQHGLFGGRITRIPPYASSSWTPLFIFQNGVEAGIVDDMTCVCDLGKTILGKLHPRRGTEERPVDELIGRDVGIHPRLVAVSQNMFALENESLPGNEGLSKSYSVTDGNFRLVATSDKVVPARGGVEFFFDMRDPVNTRSLLDFFRLDDAGYMRSFGDQDIVHPHFGATFTRDAVMEIVDTYNKLREILALAVHAKERRAMETAGAQGEANVFPLTGLTKKRMRDRD